MWPQGLSPVLAAYPGAWTGPSGVPWDAVAALIRPDGASRACLRQSQLSRRPGMCGAQQRPRGAWTLTLLLRPRPCMSEDWPAVQGEPVAVCGALGAQLRAGCTNGLHREGQAARHADRQSAGGPGGWGWGVRLPLPATSPDFSGSRVSHPLRGGQEAAWGPRVAVSC